MTKDIEQIERDAAVAAQRAEEASRKAVEKHEHAEKLRQEIQRRRSEAADAWDAAFLESYDEAELEAEEERAKKRLREAIEADPVWRAYIDRRAARMLRYHMASRARTIALGQGNRRVPREVSGDMATMPEELHMLTEQIARDVAAETLRELDDERAADAAG